MHAISGTNGTRKKRRPREWKRKFLEILASSCNVALACAGAHIGRTTAYRHRQAFPDFAEAWDDAIDEGVDRLAEEARKRALAGSDVLLMFLLKAHRPEMYRENFDMGKVVGRGAVGSNPR